MRIILLYVLLLSGLFLSAQKPNIIFIMSDDHDADAISAYTKKFTNTPGIDRIARDGMLFTKAFVGNSICAPARATILTGQHSHINGVIDNQVRFDSTRTTLAGLLKAGGYETSLIGKWGLHSLPKGFDYWKIFPGGGQYFEPDLIHMNGDTVRYHGYASDIVTDETIKYLDTISRQSPFFLMVNHKAPHRYFFPPSKYTGAFSKKIFPEPATLVRDTSNRSTAWRLQTMDILTDMLLCTDLKVDPAYLQDIPHLKPTEEEARRYHTIMSRIPEAERKAIQDAYAERGKILQRLKPSGIDLLKLKYQWFMQDYLATVASIDENVNRLLDYLQEKGLDRNTVIIYASDQDFYLGENGWFDKRWMYDVSMHTPFIIQWPGMIKAGTRSDAMIQNIDFAPTILDIADLPVPSSMQGISIKPLLFSQSKNLPRDYIYYHYQEYPEPYHNVLPHAGIRGERYKLISFYTTGEWELYDLKKDPDEQINLARRKKYKKLLRTMKKKFMEVATHYEDPVVDRMINNRLF